MDFYFLDILDIIQYPSRYFVII